MKVYQKGLGLLAFCERISVSSGCFTILHQKFFLPPWSGNLTYHVPNRRTLPTSVQNLKLAYPTSLKGWYNYSKHKPLILESRRDDMKNHITPSAFTSGLQQVSYNHIIPLGLRKGSKHLWMECLSGDQFRRKF